MSVRVPDERLDEQYALIKREMRARAFEARAALADLVADLRDARADNQRLREAVAQIAGHPVSEKDDACDWHCTLTLVSRAKDALAAQESAE